MGCVLCMILDTLYVYFFFFLVALMLALEEMQDFRVFPLPNLYNFRRTTILPVQGPKMPMIVHGHIYRSQDLNPDLYHTVAEHLAVVSMEDCVMAMKLVSSISQSIRYWLSFLCCIFVCSVGLMFMVLSFCRMGNPRAFCVIKSPDKLTTPFWSYCMNR